jgi:hypothetical protein
MPWLVLLVLVVVLLLGVALYDWTQKAHTIRRNYPLVGRLRWLLERIGPELRQYVIAGDNEERPFSRDPFSRDQRRWVYASSKQENNYFAFGTDNPIEVTPGYVLVKHRTLGCRTPASTPEAGMEVGLPCAKVLGAARGRRHAFRPASASFTASSLPRRSPPQGTFRATPRSRASRSASMSAGRSAGARPRRSRGS